MWTIALSQWQIDLTIRGVDVQKILDIFLLFTWHLFWMVDFPLWQDKKDKKYGPH